MRSRASSIICALMITGVIMLAGTGNAERIGTEEVSRLDLAKIGREIQTRGLAEYIPVAYKTIGISDEYWTTADNHAMAHFCLYMARDGSHFFFKWELPVLNPIAEGGKTIERTTQPGITGGGGAIKRGFKNSARNALLRSHSVGTMRRIWTRGPLNSMADAAHEGSRGPDTWGALIHCGIYLSGGASALGDPIAIYSTAGGSKNGDPLTGGAVMDVPSHAQNAIQQMVRTRGLAAGVSPLYWRISANMFNVTITQAIATIEEAMVQADLMGSTMCKVYNVVSFGIEAAAVRTTREAVELLIDVALDFAMDEIGVPDEWDIIRWVMFKPINRAIGELGKIVNVRILYHDIPEPFQVAPWTFVSLDGPSSGVDTWDAVEMRGGYKGRAEYEWTAGAGAVTDWGARLSVRPSIIMQPGMDIQGGCAWYISPTSIRVELHRSDENWEETDKHLVENTYGGVNAPIFMVRARPLVNYEVMDQEVLRIAGAESKDAGDRIVRKQLFHTMSLCSGAERLYGADGRIDFEGKQEQAVSLNGQALPVEVTFERGVMPQGGFRLTPQTLAGLKTKTLVPLGQFGQGMFLADYSETWWYQTGKYWKETIQDQHRYWINRRADQLDLWKKNTQEQIAVWSDTMGPLYDFRKGNIVYNPNARQFSCTKALDKLKISYMPGSQGLTLKEPVMWQRAVLEEPSVEMPDLDKIQPELKIEGGRMVLSYTNPKTGQKRALIINIPDQAAPQK